MSRRPTSLHIAIALLAFLLAWEIGVLVLGPRDVPPMRAIAVAMQFILLVALRAGFGVARYVIAAALAVHVANLGGIAAQGWLKGFSITAAAFLAARLAAVVLLFVPASNAWFREQAAVTGGAWRPYAKALIIVFGLPLLVFGVGALAGLGVVPVIVFMWVVYIPTLLFQSPHFGVLGPNDATGVMLLGAIYVFVAVVIGLAWSFVRPTGAGDAKGRRVAAATLVALIVVMLVPGVSNRAERADKRQDRVAPVERATAATAVPYPRMEGTFSIGDERGRYGVKARGHWKIGDGVLRVVADETKIWNREPACRDCARLRAWRFVMRTQHGGILGPWSDSPQLTGFNTLDVGRDGATARGHVLIVPLNRRSVVTLYNGPQGIEADVPRVVPASVLADYWIGIDLDFNDGSHYSADADNVSMFADVLADHGLVTRPPRVSPARTPAPP